MKQLDFWFNLTMVLFSTAAIALAGLNMPLWAGVCGVLSEPGYGWVAWRSKSWGLALLTLWWTGWWLVMLIGAI